LLTTLMLRGPQTLGELKQRSERLYRFSSLEDVERTLRSLADRGLVAELPRRRFGHLLGGETTAESPPDLEERVRRLEEQVAELREALLREG
jgi:uncharacterized protein YceH (UPF0502 family)